MSKSLSKGQREAKHTHTALRLSKATPVYEQLWGECDEGLIPNSRTLEANIQQRRKTTCNVPYSDVECYAAVKKQIIATHRQGAEWGQA